KYTVNNSVSGLLAPEEPSLVTSVAVLAPDVLALFQYHSSSMPLSYSISDSPKHPLLHLAATNTISMNAQNQMSHKRERP
ncbi:MAG: hypothetical protein ACFFAY_15185, partial [Promethearchaeota archaeon]